MKGTSSSRIVEIAVICSAKVRSRVMCSPRAFMSLAISLEMILFSSVLEGVSLDDLSVAGKGDGDGDGAGGLSFGKPDFDGYGETGRGPRGIRLFMFCWAVPFMF